MVLGFRSHLNPGEWLPFTDVVEVHRNVVDRSSVVLQQCFLLSSLLGFGILADLRRGLFECIL
ncbi:hypothetical protein HYC85_029058 [Camellia sinensis]|uniref:Uncharacterized protein n=1 Tax=Camellia sinensis TaxID=4442 RepID=A0A7J7FXL3_CAMSI|nr:hypothetical protein HYC85_029058 [Camellia sinensis]